jgi:hypothetical protein
MRAAFLLRGMFTMGGDEPAGAPCACLWDEDRRPPKQTRICFYHERKDRELTRLRKRVRELRKLVKQKEYG